MGGLEFNGDRVTQSGRQRGAARCSRRGCPILSAKVLRCSERDGEVERGGFVDHKGIARGIRRDGRRVNGVLGAVVRRAADERRKDRCRPGAIQFGDKDIVAGQTILRSWY